MANVYINRAHARAPRPPGISASDSQRNVGRRHASLTRDVNDRRHSTDLHVAAAVVVVCRLRLASAAANKSRSHSIAEECCWFTNTAEVTAGAVGSRRLRHRRRCRSNDPLLVRRHVQTLCRRQTEKPATHTLQTRHCSSHTTNDIMS